MSGIHKIVKKPDGVKYWYSGPVYNRAIVSKSIRTAYQSWHDQKQRCEKSSCPAYKYYGAKGITLLYTCREFIGWWLQEESKNKFKKPTISRINHDGNYEFGNIKIEEHIENCVKDVIKRHGHNSEKRGKKVAIIDLKTNEIVHISKNTRSAGLWVGLSKSYVKNLCANRPRCISKGFKFKYFDELKRVI